MHKTIDSQQLTRHLIRRAGFGLSADEAPLWESLSYHEAVNRLINFKNIPGDVDTKVGNKDCLALVASQTFDETGVLREAKQDTFSPDTNLVDALQRWVFRMVHSQRPLQEKMTLFWANHFATGRSKILEQLSFPGAIRALASKTTNEPNEAVGQIEMLRENALGNFRNILLNIAQDPAMVCWLDGETNKRGKPQENFARELMELYTIGVDSFVEADVHAAARVFTGWNLQPLDKDAKDVHYRSFKYYHEDHDTESKTFSFAIYPDGNRTIARRSAYNGIQDGIDLINALVAHPQTGRFLARKLIAFFVNDTQQPDQMLVEKLASSYYSSKFEISEVLRELFMSEQFKSVDSHWSRLSWPAEFVARSIKEIGPKQFKASTAVFAMISMGQALYDPPNPAGWRTGKAWFSTSTMLARMNFIMALCWSQKEQLVDRAAGQSDTPKDFLTFFLSTVSHRKFSETGITYLLEYLGDDENWSSDKTFLSDKAAGLVHLICASSEYQLV